MIPSRAIGLGGGLLMVAAALPDAPPPATIVAVAAAILVVASMRWRVAALGAVQLGLAALVIGDPAPVAAVLSGFAATVFLLGAYATRAVEPLRSVSLLAAAGFAAAVLAVGVVPADVAWLPVLAPILVLLAFAIVLLPYARE